MGESIKLWRLSTAEPVPAPPLVRTASELVALHTVFPDSRADCLQSRSNPEESKQDGIILRNP